VVLSAKGDAEGAFEQLREAVRLDPEDVRPRRNFARLCSAKGKLEEAGRLWREILRMEPHSSEAADALGAVLEQQGQMPAAVGFYRQAIEADPRNIESRKHLALALLAAGQTGEAVAQWREMLRLQPDDIVALNALAWIEATSGDSRFRNGKEAVALAQKAVQLLPDKSPDLLDTLAAAYAENGQFAEAAATASAAVKLAETAQNNDLAEKLRARIRCYESKTPYRENPSR
jgi:Flp pilus assembly protein TadD